MNRIISRDDLRRKAAFYAENSMIGTLMPKGDNRRKPLQLPVDGLLILREIEDAYLAGWIACERQEP